MEQSKRSLQFQKWTEVKQEERRSIEKAFLRQEFKMLVAYIVFLVLVIAFLAIVSLKQVNWSYIAVFGMISLGAVGGIANQIKEIAKIKNSEFEKRDAYIRKLQYVGKVNRKVSRYDAEIREQNTYKIVSFAKNYSRTKVKINDKVELVRIKKGQDICVFRII